VKAVERKTGSREVFAGIVEALTEALAGTWVDLVGKVPLPSPGLRQAFLQVPLGIPVTFGPVWRGYGLA
jgi:hypothetical protein